MSRPKPNDLTLEYINKRVERLFKRFKELEKLCFKWKQKDAEDILKLKQRIEGK